MTDPSAPHGHHADWLARLTALFVDSKLAPLIILAAALTGVLAVWSTPSEEEPQIIVPMAVSTKRKTAARARCTAAVMRKFPSQPSPGRAAIE